MIKKEGAVWDRVKALLQLENYPDTDTLEIATLCRGTDHLVLIKGDPIGEYNHRSDRLYIYPE